MWHPCSTSIWNTHIDIHTLNFNLLLNSNFEDETDLVSGNNSYYDYFMSLLTTFKAKNVLWGSWVTSKNRFEFET